MATGGLLVAVAVVVKVGGVVVVCGGGCGSSYVVVDDVVVMMRWTVFFFVHVVDDGVLMLSLLVLLLLFFLASTTRGYIVIRYIVHGRKTASNIYMKACRTYTEARAANTQYQVPKKTRGLSEPSRRGVTPPIPTPTYPFCVLVVLRIHGLLVHPVRLRP